MRRPLASVAVALALLAACTEDVDTPSGDAATLAATDPACPDELAEPLRAWGAVGFSGTVVVTDVEGGDDDPTCALALGLADREEGRATTLDTTFAIGSVSKAMTAAAVLDLVASGALGLDDRAGDHVPGLTGPAADATIEQLLLHTSGLDVGIGDDHEPLAHDEAVAALSALPRAVPAGTEYLYSNAGYTLLALVVEAVAGEPYRDHLAADVLTVDGDRLGGFWDGEPAAPGPRAIGYDDDGRPSPGNGSFPGPYWALAGNGDVAMTAPELARWTRALFAGEVVAPAAVDLLEATTLDHDDGTEELPGWVRFDAERFGEPVLGVAGGGGDLGHDVVTAWLPESGRVVTIASNAPEVTAEDLLVEIAPALVAGDGLPVPEETVPVDPARLDAATGTYTLDEGEGTFVVAAADGRLAVAADGVDAVAALFPPADEDDATARHDHEERVVALLAGETAAGRAELETLEEDMGEVTDVEVVGTVVADRELRTYVRVTADEPHLVWYAVDDAGGIQAVEITDEPPTLRLVPAGEDLFRASEGPDVTVAVTPTGLTVTGPDGATATATRA